MNPDYAFEFKDLAVLLGLELTEPADHADIDAILGLWVPESRHTARDLPVRPRQLTGMIR